ncbi:hypothetical protein [Pseudomonas sp. B11(2017)]|uniref:GapS6a family protein n=1 Tax=Pseudomonas sp. B11(2017) TaxID=1981748 RepID=UPI00111C3127|nr:hypothetical protein [Pseudomonas sp. B11(2017)]
MDALALSVLTSATYDLLKTTTTFTIQFIKSELKKWILDDETAGKIVSELDSLELTDELSEKAIKQKIESTNIPKLLKDLKPSQTTNITQNHYGSGDNVGGNKYC